MNIGIEFSMRKLFGDDFDVTRNGKGGSGISYGIRGFSFEESGLVFDYNDFPDMGFRLAS